MTQADKVFALYHAFSEGGDDNITEDQVNDDKIGTNTDNFKDLDQFYGILTKCKDIE